MADFDDTLRTLNPTPLCQERSKTQSVISYDAVRQDVVTAGVKSITGAYYAVLHLVMQSSRKPTRHITDTNEMRQIQTTSSYRKTFGPVRRYDRPLSVNKHLSVTVREAESVHIALIVCDSGF